MSWAEDHFSDSIAIVIAYKEWKSAKTSGRFEFGGKVSVTLAKCSTFKACTLIFSCRKRRVGVRGT